MELAAFQESVDDWIKKFGVRYFSELTNMAILTEEVGEVARLMSRMYGEQSFKVQLSESEQKDKLRDELCDVLWVVACIANQTGIDLEEGIKQNIQKKTSRDSERHVGNSKLLKGFENTDKSK
jgi:NTP pyrophosphatase (non-canonical NTP hydrolase)